VGKRFDNLVWKIVVLWIVKMCDSEGEIIVSCLLIDGEGKKRKKKESDCGHTTFARNGLWRASLTISRFDRGLYEIFPIFSYDPGKIYGSH
jgi:hypothetical protein